MNKLNALLLAAMIMLLTCCDGRTDHEKMIELLSVAKSNAQRPDNKFSTSGKMKFIDSVTHMPNVSKQQLLLCKYIEAGVLLEEGNEKGAIEILEPLAQMRTNFSHRVLRDLGIAYMRDAERVNCISNHASASCIIPVAGLGIHKNREGSTNAISVYKALLDANEHDLESRWLLNIAYMTLGQYPDSVPREFLIPDMEGDKVHSVAPFIDIASSLQLDVNNMAGGSISEDFDNDGYIDLVISGWGLDEPMHYFRNKTDGTFTDLSVASGLSKITGGLNIIQADYNNDGNVDILVLRGGWKAENGLEPNSLLRNNGDNTFEDVTITAGLLSFHPTQTAAWNDFNNDGWLDLFIGNETLGANTPPHPCELYLNNQDGTFREAAKEAKCDVLRYVKGVASGDFDNDGWKDLFLSTAAGKRVLLRNKTVQNGTLEFEDVSEHAGISGNNGQTFPTWFWDYDNDGWLDIFASDYSFLQSLAPFAAADKLGIPTGVNERVVLYHNNQDGTFTNVADAAGLNTHVFAMGSNFGDIDNDGYLDMYLGTGNPDYQSLIPNKMFLNSGDGDFYDVTFSARVGHVQKGHAVSFADTDNDGDQDIYIHMGGAFAGDAYQNALFMNPGQGSNNWICLDLKGVTANRDAIGTKLKITITENGRQRAIYRDVNSGGSFGSSPLRREIGLGLATKIDALEVTWHGSGIVQTFTNIAPNQFLRLTEGNETLEKVMLKKIVWSLPEQLCIP